jgi:hypothetical protein
MNTIELQNRIIHKILEIKNEQFLKYIFTLLSTENVQDYKLNDFEKKLIEESMADYQSGNTETNEEVFKKNDLWLGKLHHY